MLFMGDAGAFGALFSPGGRLMGDVGRFVRLFTFLPLKNTLNGGRWQVCKVIHVPPPEEHNGGRWCFCCFIMHFQRV